MYRFSCILFCWLALVSFSTSAFAVNPTFDIKSIAASGLSGNLVTGDFDNDSNADFAVPAGSGIAVFFGDATGNFTRVRIAGPALQLQIADVDGDGRPDLFAGDFATAASARVAIYRNNGDRTFTALSPVSVPNLQALSFAAGDFDGDHKADLALSMSQLTVEIMVGNGDGTFQTAQTVYTAAVPDGLTNPAEWHVETVAATGDYDGNGKQDFVASEGPQSFFGGVNVGIFLNQAGLNFTRQMFSAGEFFAPSVIDANGDGKSDLGFTWSACHTPCGGADIRSMASGTPAMIDNASWDGVLQGLPGSPVAADFNGDGVQDTAWSYGTYATFTDSTARQSVFVHLGPPTTDQAKQQSIEYKIGPDDLNNLDSMASADFNNDGAPDMVVLSIANQAIRLMLNTTPGVFKPEFRLTVAPAAATVSAGQSTTFTTILTPTGGFTQQTALTCAGLPAGATCSFAPSSLIPSNGAAKSTLTIMTTAGTSGALRNASSQMFFATMLPFLGMVFAAGERRQRKRLPLITIIAAVLVLTCISCGGVGGSAAAASTSPPPSGGGGTGGGGTPSGTLAGTYTVVITAQSAGITHTSNVQLTVE
jgi:FG-GAP-like repeat